MRRKIQTQRPQGFVVVNNSTNKGEKQQQKVQILQVIFLSSQNEYLLFRIPS